MTKKTLPRVTRLLISRFAHAMENAAGYNDIYGEAVAIGLGMATRLSAAIGQIPESDIMQVEDLIEKFELPIRLNHALKISDLMAAMQCDKKNRGGQLRFVTVTSLGTTVTSDDVDSNTIEELWRTVGAQ